MAADTRSFDFVVSFASIGAGIDDQTRAEFVALLERLGDDVRYAEVPWGMEGEVDYCIDLTERTDAQAPAIEAELRQLAERGKYVTIEKDRTCPHLDSSGS